MKFKHAIQNLPTICYAFATYDEFLSSLVKHVIDLVDEVKTDAVKTATEATMAVDTLDWARYKSIAIHHAPGSSEARPVVEFLKTPLSERRVFSNAGGNLEVLSAQHDSFLIQSASVEGNRYVPVVDIYGNFSHIDLSKQNDLGMYTVVENDQDADTALEVLLAPNHKEMADLIAFHFAYSYDFDQKGFVHVPEEVAKRNFFRLKCQYEAHRVVGNDSAAIADLVKLVTFLLQLVQNDMTEDQQALLSGFLETEISHDSLARVNSRHRALGARLKTLR